MKKSFLLNTVSMALSLIALSSTAVFFLDAARAETSDPCSIDSKVICPKDVICEIQYDALDIHDLLLRKVTTNSYRLETCTRGSNGKNCTSIFKDGSNQNCNVVIYTPDYAKGIPFTVRFQCSSHFIRADGKSTDETFILNPEGYGDNAHQQRHQLRYHNTNYSYPNYYPDDISYSSQFTCHYLN